MSVTSELMFIDGEMMTLTYAGLRGICSYKAPQRSVIYKIPQISQTLFIGYSFIKSCG